MDISGLSNNGMLAYAQYVQSLQTQQQAQNSVQSIVKDQYEQQGEQVMALIEAADMLGQVVNVMA